MRSKEEAFATDEHGITRNKGERTPSVIFANAEIHIYSKARMDPRIREGDLGAKTQRAQRKTRNHLAEGRALDK